MAEVVRVKSTRGTPWQLTETAMEQIGGLQRLALKEDIAEVFLANPEYCTTGYSDAPACMEWDVQRYIDGSIRVGCQIFAAPEVATIREWATTKNRSAA